jgi:hypothetical protein
MDLGVAVMASRDAVIRTRGLDLFVLQPSILKPLFLEPGLKKTAAAATIIVGSVGLHLDEIFFAHN